MNKINQNAVHNVFFTYDSEGNEIFEEFDFFKNRRLNSVINYFILTFHKLVLNALSLKVQVITATFVLSWILLKSGLLESEDFRYALIGIVAPAAIMRGVSEVGSLVDRNFKIKKIKQLSGEDSGSYISSDYSFIKKLDYFSNWPKFGRFFNYFLMVFHKLMTTLTSVKFQIIFVTYVVATVLLRESWITSEDWRYLTIGIVTPCVTMSDLVEIGKLISSSDIIKKMAEKAIGGE